MDPKMQQGSWDGQRPLSPRAQLARLSPSMGWERFSNPVSQLSGLRNEEVFGDFVIGWQTRGCYAGGEVRCYCQVTICVTESESGNIEFPQIRELMK